MIDIHHHLVSEPGYLGLLLREMDAVGLDRAGLIAMGPLFETLFVTGPQTLGPLDETHVLQAVRRHPDRFFGYVFVRPGYDGPDKIRRWGEQGFLGVKLHLPRENYGHYDYLPLYETARDLDMVCLFHTGLFFLPSMQGQRVSAERTRPVHVETIVNELPDLKVILAHMGGVWAEEACGMARLCPSVHVDLSGRRDGWRSAKPTAWFQEMLYWSQASSKVLLGSDVHAAELRETVAHQRGVLRAMGWDEDCERRFLEENAQRLFRFG
jgi:predicted TIM-barrel fold metal-dependent hydrolase